MDKRPSSAPPLDTEPDAKRVCLEDSVSERAKEQHRLFEQINATIDPFKRFRMPEIDLLVTTLIQIYSHAPDDARLRPLDADEMRKLINEDINLREVLMHDIKLGNYEQVMALPILQREASNTTQLYAAQGSPKGHDPDRDSHAVFQAFRFPYIGGFQKAILNVIDRNSLSNGYNPTVSIIQSSGTGKSRGVEQVAQIRFSFLFNLRPRTMHFAYPPPDDCVRDYFTLDFASTDDQIQRRYAIFLYVLFQQAHKILREMATDHSEPIAKWWYTFLNDKASQDKPGLQREAFYRDVTDKAQARLTEIQPESDPFDDLITSCKNFTKALEGHYQHDGTGLPPVKCLIAFDEAQELTHEPLTGAQTRSFFHNLGSVLKHISSTGVFVIFLSTNSNLRSLAPPPYMHPSARQIHNAQHHPPITELPFDVFARDLYTALGAEIPYPVVVEVSVEPQIPPSQSWPVTRNMPESKSNDSIQSSQRRRGNSIHGHPPFIHHSMPVTRQTQPPIQPADQNSRARSWSHRFEVFADLRAGLGQQPPGQLADQNSQQLAGLVGKVDVPLSATCTVDIMARFGRTMWHTMHANRYRSVIDLARAKLNPKDDFFKDEDARLASLGIRIGLDFDASRETGRKKELQLVESYMRIVFAVPQHREYMRSGTPSEPVLAEAAAQLLNDVPSYSFETLAPDTLSLAFESGFLARGERGEMVGRLLWTLAHDSAQRARQVPGVIKYHKPISVLEFLEHLFPENHWETIREARPVGDETGPPLEEAFKDAYIHFSHFMDGVDHKGIQLNQVYRLLLRGAALNCRRNEYSIDFMTPILFGDPEVTAIDRSKTSVLQAQIKNRNDCRDLLIDPAVAGSQANLPVLSLVHELGSSSSGVSSTNGARATRSGVSPHKRHYQIVAHGCTSDTYRVIPSNRNHLYPMLLGSQQLMMDFPRKPYEVDNWKLFNELNPCYGLEQGEDGCSWFGKDRG